ncbi:hypothetical protein JHW45_06175 [Paracoccus stylophorae]|uniref:Nucleotide-diphospho-sugar transferase domain-containing protein n=1 Tax=Paracoccus stylophorae TaxID=659350 RepID=A0ABY7SY49_9RHOB|nr:hypothetical protein [Paracoccus stylophorae]WCR11941.1 hypothetical protein JHW45_06175 [Paracoccus stylophorae]
MSNATGQDSRSETVGVVFATTGKTYNILARRAARTLKQCMPTVEIDWFTDATLKSDRVFSQIHRLSESFFRPKMEALRKSRFDRTLYLDADIIALSDVSELFTALDDFDLLAAHAEKGQVEYCRRASRLAASRRSTAAFWRFASRRPPMPF